MTSKRNAPDPRPIPRGGARMSAGDPASRPDESDHDRHPPQPARDEGLLESLGKAISAPVLGATDDEADRPPGTLTPS